MSADEVTVGIDLGTTNSVVAYWDGTKVRVCNQAVNGGLVPSIFGWKAPAAGEDRGTYLVGQPALNNWQAAPEDTVLCVKRLMGRTAGEPEVEETKQRFPYRVVKGAEGRVEMDVGGRRFAPEDVAAEYLKYLRQVAERELGRHVGAAVITVPAYFEERQRAATRAAGEKAGLRVKKVVDEPTAAAIAFGLAAPRQRQVLLVFDFGGGTLDISLMHLSRHQETGAPIFEVQEIDGDNWLGGSDMDARLVEFIVDDFKRKHGIDPTHERHFMALLRRHAEGCKIKLSAAEQVRLTLPAAYNGDGKRCGVDVVLRREQFEKLIEREVRKSVEVVERALRSQDLRPEEVTTVLLVGGATRTPLVRQRLAEVFGAERLSDAVDPMTSVAEGAAILASRLKGVECLNPQCAERKEIHDGRTGNKVVVPLYHVNADDSDTCGKCGASLAAGRAATEEMYFSEPTPRSLGVVAVKGDQANAFVCLIPKGTPYPLASPVVQTFRPVASSTDSVLVPVYEARDELGTDRIEQGVLRFTWDERITKNMLVEVGFNLDRNRTVTVTVRVKDGRVAPQEKRLELRQSPETKLAARLAPSWEETLENLVRHAGHLLKRYGGYLGRGRLQQETVREHLRQAERLLDAPEDAQPPAAEVQRLLALLEQDLMESGTATQLYLGDLAQEMTDDLDMREKIRRAQDELKAALQARQQAEAEVAEAALGALVSKVWSHRKRDDSPVSVLTYDPVNLLQVDV